MDEASSAQLSPAQTPHGAAAKNNRRNQQRANTRSRARNDRYERHSRQCHTYLGRGASGWVERTNDQRCSLPILTFTGTCHHSSVIPLLIRQVDPCACIMCNFCFDFVLLLVPPDSECVHTSSLSHPTVYNVTIIALESRPAL